MQKKIIYFPSLEIIESFVCFILALFIDQVSFKRFLCECCPGVLKSLSTDWPLFPWQFFFVTFVRTEHIVSESEFNATAGLDGEVDVEMEGVVTAEHLLPASFVEQMREAVPRERYLYPSYLSNFGVLILIAIAVIAQLTHLTKILLLLSIAGNFNKIKTFCIII